MSISGAARVVEDLERKKAMWNTAAQAGFPGGPTDPDLALVAVLIAEAEYWDVKSNQAVQLFKMAKARRHRQAAQGHGRGIAGYVM